MNPYLKDAYKSLLNALKASTERCGKEEYENTDEAIIDTLQILLCIVYEIGGEHITQQAIETFWKQINSKNK